MTHLVKYLLYKHQDLIWVCSTPIKTGHVVVCIYNLSAGSSEDKLIPGTCWAISLAKISDLCERLCLKK